MTAAALGSAFLGGLAAPTIARATLGTHRVMQIGFVPPGRYGRKSYPASLPLSEGEVVLTFDDGPLPGPTDRVLDALAREQCRATFFLIGRNAAASPHLVRRMLAEGHTIANHTMNHPWTMRNIAFERGIADIRAGAAAITQAAGQKPAPFFRFPGFADTPALLDHLQNERQIVLGTDFWASDWNPMTPDVQLSLVMRRLRQSRGGMVLFHDVRPQTAAMLPGFLAALREGGYRVVHITG
jgi:peptidoglycan/xylan/chitin deacetylase (PgdA/CDA1 family)